MTPEAWPSRERLRELHGRAEAAAAGLRLRLGERPWRGPAGHFLGTDAGQSLDYQDHRPFLPGDDPRHLDWSAYARTGQYILKVYREEVAPQLDLVLDVSTSMFFDPAKRDRSLELLYFCVESASRARISLTCWHLVGAALLPMPEAWLRAHDWPPPEPSSAPQAPPELARVPWRARSLRVFISDLLFPADPRSLLAPLSRRRGFGLILAPYCGAESDPDWRANREFIDVETGRRRRERVDPAVLHHYRRAYARHFALLEEEARRRSVRLARIGSHEPFPEALRAGALAVEAVEPWG